MKKWRNVFVGIVLLGIALLFLAGGCTSWSRPKNEIKGNTTTEKFESLAGVITAENDNFLFVKFVGYESSRDVWRFALFIPRHTVNEVMLEPRSASGGEPQISGVPLVTKYMGAVEKVFVEASRILPQKKGKIELIAVFSDLKGFVNSTDQVALMDSDAENWMAYTDSVDEVAVIPSSLFRELLQEAFEAGRQGQGSK